MTIRDYIDKTFNHRRCPNTAKKLLGHKYLLPNYRAPDYPDQDDLNRHTLANLIFCTTPGMEAFFDDVMKGVICNTMLALRCNRPTLFLERELGEVLLKSQLPLDLETSDIKFPWPGFRIILPRHLLTIGGSSLMFIDIGFLDSDDTAICPRDIAFELDRLEGFSHKRLYLRGINFCYTSPALIVNGTLDDVTADMETPTAYGAVKPWHPATTLSTIKEYKGALNTNWPNDANDTAFVNRMENLALNLLILLSTIPAEYEPDHVHRQARMEGKNLKPALLRAKWVGDHLVRARKAGFIKGELTNQHKSAHWVSAHWRRQPHGVGLTLRKLIWILPYRTGVQAQTGPTPPTAQD